MGNDTVQLRGFFLFVVTLLALAVGATVTTPAAAQTAGCAWPYTNNVVLDGRYETNPPTDPVTWMGYLPERRTALTDHPCGWGWGYKGTNGFYNPAIQINAPANKYISARLWVKPLSEATSGRVYIQRIYTDNLIEPAGVSGNVISSGWQYHELCLAPTSDPSRSGETSYIIEFKSNLTPGMDEILMTGLFVTLDSSACLSPIPAPTPVPTATPTATPIPTATPNYGRVLPPRYDLPVQPPTGGGVDLAGMGLPPLPEAQGLLDPNKAPPGAKLNAVFWVNDLGTLVGTAREVTTYIFSTTIWRMLLFFGLVAFATKKLMQFHNGGGGQATSAPTHINHRR